MVTLTFLTPAGNEITKTLPAGLLEDATIVGSTIAEDNGWELVAVEDGSF